MEQQPESYEPQGEENEPMEGLQRMSSFDTCENEHGFLSPRPKDDKIEEAGPFDYQCLDSSNKRDSLKKNFFSMFETVFGGQSSSQQIA